MHEKQFTPELANAALPLVRRIVADVVHHHARVADLATEYKKKKREPGASQIALNDAKQQIVVVTSQRDACVAELV